MSARRGGPEVAATFKIRYGDERTAHAVQAAVSPDNFQAPRGIVVEAEAAGPELRLSVASSSGMGSLIATVDDLLSCVQAAERALRGIRGRVDSDL